MKIRDIAMLIALCMTLLAAGCGNTGSTAPASGLPENAPKAEPEEIQDCAADLVIFSDTEAFAEYVLSAEKGADAAELSSLRDYFIPTGIPETYQLYKITAGVTDIGFWYLPEACLSSADTILDAESRQKHFLFLSTRGAHEPRSIAAQFGAVPDELPDGKYFVCEGTDKIVIWEQYHTSFMLYLPADYKTDSVSSLCTVAQYTKNEETHTFERIEEAAGSPGA